ncbi:glutathione S-transferase domain-containing protein [Obelidium mucronatum]|nr:glutathione S-transferase domain-containing protein [Obelidium mucronatum]
MKLFSSTSSPFARKVLIVAKEVGIYHQLQVIPTSVNPAISTAIDNLSPLNPLSKIPTLHVPGMGPLFGSSVIAQYIISTSQNNTILPHDVTRFAVLTREALADGASEAMLLMRFETALRPKDLYWKEFYDGQFAKVCRAFDEMEKHVENETKEDVKWDLGDIATLCALSYADLRFGDVFDWRVGRPVLAAWYIQQGDLRDSVKETALA